MPGRDIRGDCPAVTVQAPDPGKAARVQTETTRAARQRRSARSPSGLGFRFCLDHADRAGGWGRQVCDG